MSKEKLVILHVTAHMGGGIGKALSRLIEENTRSRRNVQHVVAVLEKPEKHQFIKYAQSNGGNIFICPTTDILTEQIKRSDIVQVEWWHHPAVMSWMCSDILPPMRLIVWCHVSGIHIPSIPIKFVAEPARFLFTSPCSWENSRLASLEINMRMKIGTVFSSGGFYDLPISLERYREKNLRVGYVGTLNFSKIHPRILDFLSAVNRPNFKITLVGDVTGGKYLIDEAKKRGLSDLIDLKGYSFNVANELAQFDVFAYLLNPLHYGTTENALLEAMAMGVVPIVLDNPAERHLVQHGETGIVVRNPHEFAQALDFLQDHPEELQRLSRAASCTVRERFSLEKTASGLLKHYREVVEQEKRLYDFRPIFGETPADWFRACLGPESWRFHDDGTVNLEGNPPEILLECNKASIFQYQRNFPDSPLLAAWRKDIERKIPNDS